MKPTFKKHIWTLAFAIIIATTAIIYGYLSYKNTNKWPIIISITAFGFIIFNTLLFFYLNDKTQQSQLHKEEIETKPFYKKLAKKIRLLFNSEHSQNTNNLPFSQNIQNWIQNTSKGKKNTIGFGSQVSMDDVGATVILPKTFTNLHSKTGETNTKNYKKTIGLHTGVKTVELSHFVHISGMSYGALSFRANAALNLGAKRAGILHNIGEGGLAKCHEYGGGDLIYQIGSAKYGIKDYNGDIDETLLKDKAAHPQIKMFEIKLAQGAKPGKGGMLLKEKITKEISDIRNIPMGEDSHSPARHKEFSDVDGLFNFIGRIRKIVKKPIGIKIVIGHTEEIESIAKKIKEEPGRGPDYIVIDGGEGGTGAAPSVLSSYSGLPLKQALATADWALKSHGVRDKVVLFASGKIATPIDIAVAMALGAEAVFIARGFLLALGCIQALECHSNNCPTGITSHDKELENKLDIHVAAKRVATYADKLYKESQMLAESCGYNNPEQINDDDIMVVTSPGRLEYLSSLHSVSAYEAATTRRKAKKVDTSVGDLKILMDEVNKFKQGVKKVSHDKY
ncbi:FMN-binding glutamate synthase family protein [Flavobacteriaceae bacterium]|nr:FMN-binding glutamate synthase family protein [Flavobacteriaceae bacterium]